MKLTRRQLVTTAAATTAGAAIEARAQTTPAAPSDAAKQLQQNADALAKFAIPMTTEPAFQFKA